MYSLACSSVLQQFQQHDVQELNRILFTAIESSLVGTSGKDIINKLYHGKLANKVRLHELYTVCQVVYGPQHKKTCLRGFANNTGADQPAHPRSLISAFMISILESTIPKLATSEISFF